MERRYRWISVIIGAAALTVVAMQAVYLRYVVNNTVREKALSAEKIITETTAKLSVKSFDSKNGLTYTSETKELHYLINGKRITREVDENVSDYWIASVPVYDVRDTSRWTLEALNEMIQEESKKRMGRTLPLRLTETDSAGNTLHALEWGEAERGFARRHEQELGFLSRNRLRAEYVLPRRMIWEATRERAGFLAVITLLLGGCLFAAYRNNRIERRNARIRDLCMSLYRHDLRTPIDTVFKRVYQLRQTDEGRFTPKDRERIEAIDLSTRRIGHGIEQLVAVQVCEGKVNVDFRDVDANELLQEVVQRERWYAGMDSEARIETDLRAERATVRGNREALESMFQNVIENALKYGGEELTVRVSSENTAEGGIRVTVADNGEGIPEEELKHIFERKYRGRHRREKTTGTGMGLYMARFIAKAHGGRIEAESKTGKGCRFTIVLPLKKEEK